MSTQHELITRPTALWTARTRKHGRTEVTLRWVLPKRRAREG